MAQNNAKVYLNLETDMSTVISQIQKSVGDLSNTIKKIEQNKGISNLEKSFKNSKDHIDKTKNAIGGFSESVSGIALKFAGVVTAILGVQKIAQETFNLFKTGVQFNLDTETTKIGLAGLITSLNNIKKDGKEVTGLEAFNISTFVAEDQLKKLRVAAIKTSATLSDVTTAFQAGLSPGLSKGFNVDQVREISVLIANTAKSMKLTGDQVAQELRAILSGEVTGDAQIATSLGLGSGGALQQAYKDALKAGQGYDFLKDKLKDFAIAGEATSNTLSGAIDASKDFFEIFAGQVSSDLTKNLGNIGKEIQGMFDVDTGEFTEGLSNVSILLNYIGGEIGNTIVSIFSSIYKVVEDIGISLEKDAMFMYAIQNVGDLISGTFNVVKEIFTQIFNIIVDVVSGIADALGVSSNLTSELSSMQKVLIVVNTLIVSLKLSFLAVKNAVIIVADAVRSILGGAIKGVSAAFSNFIRKNADAASFFGLDEKAKQFREVADSIDQFSDKLSQKTVGADNSVAKLLNGDTSGVKNVFSEFKKEIDNVEGELAKAYGKVDNNFIVQQKKKIEEQKKVVDEIRKAQLDGIEIASKNKGVSDEKPKKEKKVNLEKLERDRLKALKDYRNEMMNIQNQILEITGRGNEVRVIKFRAEIEDLKEKYSGDSFALSKIKELESVRGYFEEVNSLKEKYNSIIDAQSNKEEYVNSLKNSGNISEIEQLNRVKKIRSENLDVLTETIKKMEQISQNSGNEKLISDVEKMKASFVDFSSQIDPLADRFNNLFKDSFEDNFSKIIAGTKSAKEAFQDLAATISYELSKLAVNNLLTNIGGSGSDGFGNIFGNFISSIFGGGSARASGGLVKAGSVYTINESGKNTEKFIPNSDGFILNSEKTRQLNSSTNNSNSVTNINFNVKDAKSFMNSRNQISAKLAAMIASTNRNK